MKDNVFPVNERAKIDVERNLEELIKTCECSIRIGDGENKLRSFPYYEIELNGENEKVSMAKKHIFEVIIRDMTERYEYEKCTGYVSCFLPFTPEDIKIALADFELQSLQQNCNGIVIMKEPDERFHIPIMVRGIPDGIERFTKQLTTKIEEYREKNLVVSRTIQVSVQDILWLMSRNGEMVKQIETKTNAKCITDNKTYYGHRTLTITGKFDDVAEAKKTVNHFILEHHMDQKIGSSSKHYSHDEQGNRNRRETSKSSKRFSDKEYKDHYRSRQGYKHRKIERSSERHHYEDHDRSSISEEDQRDNQYSRQNHRNSRPGKRHRQYGLYD